MSDEPVCASCGSPEFGLIHATMGPQGGCIASLRAQLAAAVGRAEKAERLEAYWEAAHKERCEDMRKLARKCDEANARATSAERELAAVHAAHSRTRVEYAAERGRAAEVADLHAIRQAKNVEIERLRAEVARLTGERNETQNLVADQRELMLAALDERDALRAVAEATRGVRARFVDGVPGIFDELDAALAALNNESEQQ